MTDGTFLEFIFGYSMTIGSMTNQALWRICDSSFSLRTNVIEELGLMMPNCMKGDIISFNPIKSTLVLVFAFDEFLSKQIT